MHSKLIVLFVCLLLFPISIMVLMYFIKKMIHLHIIKQKNVLAIPIHAAVTVVYPVLLFFIVVIVWDKYTKAAEAVDLGTNTLIEPALIDVIQ